MLLLQHRVRLVEGLPEAIVVDAQDVPADVAVPLATKEVRYFGSTIGVT